MNPLVSNLVSSAQVTQVVGIGPGENCLSAMMRFHGQIATASLSMNTGVEQGFGTDADADFRVIGAIGQCLRVRVTN